MSLAGSECTFPVRLNPTTSPRRLGSVVDGERRDFRADNVPLAHGRESLHGRQGNHCVTMIARAGARTYFQIEISIGGRWSWPVRGSHYCSDKNMNGSSYLYGLAPRLVQGAPTIDRTSCRGLTKTCTNGFIHPGNASIPECT